MIVPAGRPATSPRDLFHAVGVMTDADLEARLQRLAWVERRALVALLVHLSEFDSRRLYADRGQPSLFAYCHHILGYSEQGAYKRIQAARAAREYPVLLERLASGAVHLAGIVVLAPHLKPDNAVGLLDAARGKSIRELERVAASLSPRADVAESLRALPQPARSVLQPQPALAEVPDREVPPQPAGAVIAARTPAVSEPASPKNLLDPLSAERFLFRFTGGRSLREKYDRARDLLRLRTETGAMEAIFERALDALLDRLDPLRRHERRRGTARSASGSFTRAIPAAVRDAVWARDACRCTFLSPEGARCPATRWLEIDHIIPYALGGSSDDVANLRLLCRAHNQLSARRIFGTAARRRGRRSQKPSVPTSKPDYPRG